MEKPDGRGRKKIGGANAPPTVIKWPQKCGQIKWSRKHSFGRIFAAWLWPGGHSLGDTPPRFAIQLYLVLDFPLQLLVLTKWLFISGFKLTDL